MWLAAHRGLYQVPSSTREMMCHAEPKLDVDEDCQNQLWGQSAAGRFVWGEHTLETCNYWIWVLFEGRRRISPRVHCMYCRARLALFFLREPFVKILAAHLCREDRTALCWGWGWHFFPACGVCKGAGEGCHLMVNPARLQHAELTYLAGSFQARLLLSRHFLNKSCVQLQKKVCALTLRPTLPEPGVFWFLDLSTFYVRAKW